MAAQRGIIETENLQKTYYHPLFVWVVRARALRGLNLSVQPGEVYGLLGPNGSGKSTAIKLLLGLVWPTAGHASVFGKRPDDVAVKERIGFLPEETRLYRFLNAEETLDFYGRLFGIRRVERQKRIAALLELVGLTSQKKRQVAEYSKGMQRRIGLAQALLNDPELVILDEPTSGMDPLGTREIKDLIVQLKSRKKTVLLSSHLLADVEDVCDRVTILYGGKAQSQGVISDLVSDQAMLQITAQMSSEVAQQAKDFIASRIPMNADDIKVSPPQERLETYFLRVVKEAAESGQGTSGADSSESTSQNRDEIMSQLLTEQQAGANLISGLTKEQDVDGQNEEKLDNLRENNQEHTINSLTTGEDEKSTVKDEVKAQDETVKRDVLDQLK